MEVLGRKITVIEKDSQFKPDVGKSQLAAAFADDKADIAKAIKVADNAKTQRLGVCNAMETLLVARGISGGA